VFKVYYRKKESVREFPKIPISCLLVCYISKLLIIKTPKVY